MAEHEFTPASRRGNPPDHDELDGHLLETAMLGDLAPAGARVRILRDLGAVALMITADDGAEVELVLAPAAAVALAIRLSGAALRLASGDRT
jgi:hypothetical protein